MHYFWLDLSLYDLSLYQAFANLTFLRRTFAGGPYVLNIKNFLDHVGFHIARNLGSQTIAQIALAASNVEALLRAKISEFRYGLSLKATSPLLYDVGALFRLNAHAQEEVV